MKIGNNHKFKFPDNGQCLPMKPPTSIKNDINDVISMDCRVNEFANEVKQDKAALAHAEDVIAGQVSKIKEYIKDH